MSRAGVRRARPYSFRSQLLRSAIRRTKNTHPIADTVAAEAGREVNGRPDPIPPRWVLRGIDVARVVINDTVVFRLRSRRKTPHRAILYFHGGGYIEGLSVGSWMLAARLLRTTGSEVWMPAYRLAPRQTAKRTRAVALETYRTLMTEWSPSSIAVIGDSAGGGLALSCVQAAHEAGIPVPALLGLFAPWVDLTMSDVAEATTDDAMLDQGRLRESALAYGGGEPLTDPRVSPINGLLGGLPPTWLIVGGDDILVHQNRRLRDRMRSAGTTVTYIEDPGMVHVHVMMPIPEGRRSLARFAEAVKVLR